MSDSTIEEIKSKIDIVELIREYINIEKAGTNHRALCPFHSEKTPSFFINQSRQIWRCFGGCNEGGDIFKFVMKIEGVEFSDALRILAKKAGVELKRRNIEGETRRKRLSDICNLSSLFFERQLQKSKGGEKAKEYLYSRKITDDSIKKWRIGYAPTAKDALSKFLIGEGYNREEIKEAGMAVGKGENIYDRFRARIMFPISSLNGSVVGFGGRVVLKGDERAKYINTPATPLYDKSSIIYGLHNAKVDIRRRGFVVIVEGYTDVILSHQAGYENVVSSSGTALTSNQLNILGRYTKKLFTAFDMDEAGGSATKKGIDIALQKDFDIRVIMMPEDDDPADIVSRDVKEWEECIKNAQPVIEFYFKNILSKYNLSDPHEKGKAGRELIPEIEKIKNSIEKAHFISKLSDILGVDESSIIEEMNKTNFREESREKRSLENPYKKNINISRKERLEERILNICVKNKELTISLQEEDVEYFKEETKNIIIFLKGEKDSLDDKEKEIFDYFSLIPETGSVKGDEELRDCLREMKKESIREKLRETEVEMKQAERERDEEKQEELSKKFKYYSEKLQII